MYTVSLGEELHYSNDVNNNKIHVGSFKVQEVNKNCTQNKVSHVMI